MHLNKKTKVGLCFCVVFLCVQQHCNNGIFFGMMMRWWWWRITEHYCWIIINVDAQQSSIDLVREFIEFIQQFVVVVVQENKANDVRQKCVSCRLLANKLQMKTNIVCVTSRACYFRVYSFFVSTTKYLVDLHQLNLRLRPRCSRSGKCCNVCCATYFCYCFCVRFAWIDIFNLGGLSKSPFSMLVLCCNKFCITLTRALQLNGLIICTRNGLCVCETKNVNSVNGPPPPCNYRKYEFPDSVWWITHHFVYIYNVSMSFGCIQKNLIIVAEGGGWVQKRGSSSLFFFWYAAAATAIPHLRSIYQCSGGRKTLTHNLFQMAALDAMGTDKFVVVYGWTSLDYFAFFVTAIAEAK